jgi:pimeloyl-ACP methyl ester carboxylesterase
MQRNAFLIPEPQGVTLKPPPPPAIERLQDIDIPVLLITGALDLEEKNALAERLTRDLPDVRHLSLPAAHMMSLEQPASFNEAVLSFLRGLTENT